MTIREDDFVNSGYVEVWGVMFYYHLGLKYWGKFRCAMINCEDTFIILN